ncbi:MAG: hypothetical protein ABIU63_03815 [Chitinophagaceae bacterium]
MNNFRTLSGALIVLAFIFTGCKKSNDDSATLVPPASGYNNVKFTSIAATSIPMTKPNGGAWQTNGGPNVYFEIKDANDVVLYRGGTINNVTTANLPLSWNFTNAFQVTTLNTEYKFIFYNKNAVGADDQMDGYIIKMNDYKTGNPATVTLSNASSKLVVKLSATWY